VTFLLSLSDTFVMVTPVCKSMGTSTSSRTTVVPLDSDADLRDVLSDMAMVGETWDWLRLGGPGALCDREIDGGRPACIEWLRPRLRFTLTLDRGGAASSFAGGLRWALDVERRRRSLSGAPAD